MVWVIVGLIIVIFYIGFILFFWLLVVVCFSFGFFVIGWFSLFIVLIVEKVDDCFIGLIVSIVLMFN